MERPPSLGHQKYGEYGEGCAIAPARQVMAECRTMVKTLVESHRNPARKTAHCILAAQRKKVDVEILTLPIERSAVDPSNSFYLLLIFSKSERSETRNLIKRLNNINLTPKEIEISQYICQGLTNKQIGQMLYISLPTVATHVQHILHKAGISRRSQLVSQMLS